MGDESLSRRPMRRVIEPLERMGGRVEATDGHAPLTIRGAALRGMTHRFEVPSAQVKSAVLLAGLHAEGTTSVIEPAQTRDHTERALVGIRRRSAGQKETPSRLPGSQRLTAQSLSVPGDFSSAAFWMVAAAALPGSRVEIEDVGLNPTRTALIGVLQRFGARVLVEITGMEAGEPRGTVLVESDRTGSIEISPEEVPGLIDELPAIAALAAHGGEVSVRGAAELRVKESDRIAALVAGFRSLGIAAEERPDGFVVGGSGARRRMARSMPAAITAWRWRSRLQRWRAGRPRQLSAPTRSPFPIPASSTRWTGSWRESRQGVSGRFHGRG